MKKIVCFLNLKILIMKKIILILLLLNAFTNTYSQPVEKKEAYTEKEEYDDGCFIIYYQLGAHLLVLDCPDYDYEYGNGNIVIEKICNNLTDVSCKYSFQMKINGFDVYAPEINLGNLNTEENKRKKVPIDFTEITKLITSIDYKENFVDVEFIIYKNCFGKNKQEASRKTVKFQVRRPGQAYIVTERGGVINEQVCDELYKGIGEIKDQATKCCDGPKIISEFKIVKQTGGGFKIDGSLFISRGNSSSSNTIELGSAYYNWSTNYYKSYIIRDELILIDGYCVYPGLLLSYREYIKKVMKVVCDGPDETISIGNTTRELFDAHFRPCKYKPDCSEMPPNYKINSIVYQNLLGEIIGGCSGDIILDFPNSTSMHYEYVWNGPDGKEYYDKNLYDVPFGKYELTIYDECCNEFHKTYNLCERTEYSNWSYENNKYCADVRCFCDPEGPESKTYRMCVVPDYYDDNWSLDENGKKYIKHAYWTGQNGVEIDLTEVVNEADINAKDKNVYKEPNK